MVSYGRLQFIGNSMWKSSSGLIYDQGSKEGNRVLHVLQHTKPDITKSKHTVFNVGKDKLLSLIDEAWDMRGKVNSVVQKNGNEVFDIPMSREIGTNGETKIRIVVEKGTSNIVTSYPIN